MSEKRIVDLTLTLRSGMETWPGTAKFTLLDKTSHEFSAPRYNDKYGCKGFADRIVVCWDHAGTHADSLYHFFPDKETIEAMPLEAFMGDAVLIDVSLKHKDEFVTKDILEKAVKEQGVKIKKGDIALVRVWPGQFGESGYFDCKGFSRDGAEWLKEKKVKAVGVNLGGIDYYRDFTRPSHMTFLGAGIPIYENLVNLEKIGRTRFQFIGLPVKWEGATGSPVRAVAIV